MKRNLSSLLFSIMCIGVALTSCENPLFIQQTGLYTVDFSTNGGTAVEAMRTDKIKEIPRTEKQNCDFAGWYTTSDFSGDSVLFPYSVTEDATLYARWKQKYTVTFNSNGGTEIPPAVESILQTAQQPSKTDCTFYGWYLSPDLDGEPVDFPLELSKDTTLYAKWLVNYTLSFSTNGGTDVSPVKAAVLSELPKPTKTDYEFSGWYEKADCSGQQVQLPYVVSKDTVLYAKWLPTYLISFETDGGSEIPLLRARTVESAPVPEKPGFSFAGWYRNAGRTETADFPLTLSADITLYAQWKRNFTVTFDSQGGSAVEPVYGCRIEEEPQTTRESSSLAGWYTDSGCSDGSKVSFPFEITQDITLYAKWTAEMYTITYDANGATGGNAPKRQSVEKGKSVKISENSENLTKTGFTFTKWSTSTDGKSGQTYSAGQTVTPSGNMTLYAQWGTDYGAMIPVEGGTFKMGDPDSASRPTITLSGFQIAQYELTYELWLEVANWARENKSYTITNARKGYATNDQFKSFVPAMNFSWNMACVWLNAYSEYKGLEPVYYRGSSVWRDETSTSGTFKWDTTKNGFRLPTECEWEYAAGGGNLPEVRTTYSGSNNINDVAWHYDNSGKEAHPVGTKKPNQLGIYDMSGSVAEWCYDYHASYGNGKLENPVHENGNYRCLRGGNIRKVSSICTIYCRGYEYRTSSIYDDYYSSCIEYSPYTIGLRPARNAE